MSADSSYRQNGARFFEFMGNISMKRIPGPIRVKMVPAVVIGLSVALGACSSKSPEVATSSTNALDIMSGRALARGIGLREDIPEINAQPRAELVIPPSRDLPSPENVAQNRPEDWPEDPDILAAKEREKARQEPLTVAEIFANSGFRNVRVVSEDIAIDPSQAFREEAKNPDNRMSEEEMRELARERLIAQQEEAATNSGGNLAAPPTSHLVVTELDHKEAVAISKEAVPGGRFGSWFGRRGRSPDEHDAFTPKDD